MPFSSGRFDGSVGRFIRAAYPERGTCILDVGAGQGRYRSLLSDYPNMFACDVFAPYAERYDYKGRYAGHWIGSIVDIDPEALETFDLAILGDVLEHLEPSDAQWVLARMEAANCAAVVVVPFSYHQEGTEENPHEEHLQPDLTREVMQERYPGLSRIGGDRTIGVYGSRLFFSRLRGPGKPLAEGDRHEITAEDVAGLRVAICTPHTGSVVPEYAASISETTLALHDLGVQSRIYMRKSASIDRVRNQLVRDALDDPFGCTHLLWVDSDQGWHAQDLLRLLVHKRPVIGAASIKKEDTLEWAVSIGDQEGLSLVGGCLKVDGVGTGFLLIERAVFEALKEKYPERRVRRKADTADEPDSHNFYTLFQTGLDDNNRYISEDLAFCNLWRAIGGDVWVDPFIDLQHVGQKTWTGALSTHMTQGAK